MVYGKKIEDKKSRGKAIDLEIEGVKFKLVSIFHPYQAIAEPKNAFLFSHDIKEAILEHILNRPKIDEFTYTPIFSIKELKTYEDKFIGITNPISCDTEGTGLNFLTDTLHTIAFTKLDNNLEPEITIAFPIDHREFVNPEFRKYALEFSEKVLGNSLNRKIFQNAQHDLKFLRKYGITIVPNIWDTKLMFALVDENSPKSLSDLVYYLYNHEDRT
jgi:hypothetical protein